MPKVSSLTVYPVKGLKGIELQQAKVTRTGEHPEFLSCDSQQLVPTFITRSGGLSGPQALQRRFYAQTASKGLGLLWKA